MDRPNAQNKTKPATDRHRFTRDLIDPIPNLCPIRVNPWLIFFARFGTAAEPWQICYFVVANCLTNSSCIDCSFCVIGPMRACINVLAFCMAIGIFSIMALPAGEP
jgi:hypothetical protein